MLGRFGLDLACRLDIWNQGDMDKKRVLPAHVKPELADRLKKRQTFYVADGAADLDDGHVRITLHLVDGIDYLIRDMRDDLYGPTLIFPSPLFGNDRVVDTAGGVVVSLPHHGICVSLVMTQIKVGFSAVVRHINLAVLKGVHGAGIDVDVRVEFLKGNGQTAAFKKGADCSGSQALAKRGKYAAGDENILCFGVCVGRFHRP